MFILWREGLTGLQPIRKGPIYPAVRIWVVFVRPFFSFNVAFVLGGPGWIVSVSRITDPVAPRIGLSLFGSGEISVE